MRPNVTAVVEHPAGEARLLALERPERLRNRGARHLHLVPPVGALTERRAEADGDHGSRV